MEIDLGKQTGPPAKGGIAVTTDSGVATFQVKPGDYVIFFNLNSFPQNLNLPKPQNVTVLEGKTNQVTMELTTK